MRNLTRSISALAAVALLTGCSQAEPNAKPTPVSFVGCVLSDNSGFDDQSVGSEVFKGALQAQAQYGMKIRYVQVAANASYADYSSDFKTLMANNCGAVVGIGGASEVVEHNASLFPKVDFALVHGRRYGLGEASGISPENLPNVKSISYASEQGGFLAGYLAATQSQSHFVAGFGATLNRSELAMLSGFSQGVRYANSRNNLRVELLGQADATSDLWVTVGQANSSETQKQLQKFAAQGADVIFPVVGGTDQMGPGQAATAAASTASSKLAVLGSVSNWYKGEAVADSHQVVLGSVVLTIQRDVAAALGDSLNGSFVGGPAGDYIGNLQNSGVFISGANDIAFNASYTTTIDSLKSQIVAGEIRIFSAFQ